MGVLSNFSGPDNGDIKEISGQLNNRTKFPSAPTIIKVSGVSKIFPELPPESEWLVLTAKPSAITNPDYYMFLPAQVGDSGGVVYWAGTSSTNKGATASMAPETSGYEYVYPTAGIRGVTVVGDDIRVTGGALNWGSIDAWGNTTSVFCQGMPQLTSIPFEAPTLLSGPFWRANVFNSCSTFNGNLNDYFSLGVDSSLRRMFRNTAQGGEFGNLDLSSVTDISEMFSGASNMTDANISETLLGWDVPATNSNIDATDVFGTREISETVYPGGKIAYDNLVARGWTITGLTWTVNQSKV